MSDLRTSGDSHWPDGLFGEEGQPSPFRVDGDSKIRGVGSGNTTAPSGFDFFKLNKRYSTGADSGSSLGRERQRPGSFSPADSWAFDRWTSRDSTPFGQRSKSSSTGDVESSARSSGMGAEVFDRGEPYGSSNTGFDSLVQPGNRVALSDRQWAAVYENMVATTVLQKQRIEKLEDKECELSSRCDEAERRLEMLERGKSNGDDVAAKMNRLLEFSFWAIVLLGGISAITLVLSAVNMLFCVDLPPLVDWALGFVGMGGVIALLAYMRKLGKLNARVDALERKGVSGG